jgi:WD40 repeat protein
VSLSSDGGLLATGSGDAKTRLYKKAGDTWKPVHKIVDAMSPILSVSLTSDGALLATSCAGGTTRLYKKAGDTWKPVQTIEDSGIVESVSWTIVASASWTSDGALLATGSNDAKTRLYKKAGDAWKLVQTIEDASGDMFSLS